MISKFDASATTNNLGHDGQKHDPDLVHNMAIASLYGEFFRAITTQDAAHLDRVQGNE